MEISVRTYPDDDEREWGKLCTLAWNGPQQPIVVCHGNALVVVDVIAATRYDAAALAALPCVLTPSDSDPRRPYDLLGELERRVVDFCAGVKALRMFHRPIDQLFFDDISVVCNPKRLRFPLMSPRIARSQ